MLETNRPDLLGNRDADYTALWLDLYKTALRRFRKRTFDNWCFGVGLGGSDKERYLKGKELMSTMDNVVIQMHKDGNP